jgi:two-component system, OmpR family, sensor histidine kinase KdpD
MPDKVAGRGNHKIFLGFAAGVGKTYAMLDEAVRRKNRGQDVVIGYVNSYNRPATEDLLTELEVIPQVGGLMDIKAIFGRKPDLVIVDELAYSNPAGSKNEKRWQDVQDLLEHGISVLSTLNIQHLESLNDHIADITGFRETETVPDQVLHDAQEVEIIDLTPRALLNRIERGDVFDSGTMSDDQKQFYRVGNLAALREIALREVATRVDEDVVEYRKEKRIEKPWATQDRVLVCLGSTRSALRLLRRGWRMGQRMHGEVMAVHIEDGSSTSEQGKKILEEDFALAKRLGIKTFNLQGEVGPTIVKLAKEKNITALVIGHPNRSRLQGMFKPMLINELVRDLRTVDIIVVATESSESHS